MRIFNTFGPNMNPHDGRVVSNFIMQALQNEDITIYGNGEQTRAFCYVSDLIQGLIAMMELTNLTGPVNLGNPVETTVRALAEKIITMIGSKSRIVFRPLPQDDPVQRCPDISIARQALGWEPSVALEDGLRQTIDYFAGTKAHTAADWRTGRIG